jgi:hypothetical protein
VTNARVRNAHTCAVARHSKEYDMNDDTDFSPAHGFRVEPVVLSRGSRDRTRDGQLTFFNLLADPMWKLREALDPRTGLGIALPPDPQLAAQLAAPTWQLRNTAILIESKEEICKRLGTSTDIADAVTIAWHLRDQALRRQNGSRLMVGRGVIPGGWSVR